MPTPLDNITDGHEFQRLVAEYFSYVSKSKRDSSIVDVNVANSGVGSDRGCDILVEYHISDGIGSHKLRWVIECKCLNKSVGVGDINSNNLLGIVKSKKAVGYLLVCKTEPSQPLLDFFKDLEGNEKIQVIVWNGSRLWSKFNEHLDLIRNFFPEHYRKTYQESSAEETFDEQFNKLKKRASL